MREAVLYTTGKPDNAGSPQPGSTYTFKRSRPEALLCLMGSLTEREAQ